ncbi:uncharacterized protein K02A2.6-like [Malaya genurostris]|uniref:uncharacterized protein K02A2.6-like n=1 Tax=Malaya genurostris TaxID=325434 RepID=UPI0026F388AF|nr:uncharacterized protein K02A2.6-like [Malaya genurostris]
MLRKKALTRSYVCWSGVNSDIVNFVKACHQCASVARSPPHAPPVSWSKPIAPWQRVHIDYAKSIEGEHYLIVVDAFTKLPEIIQTNRISSVATITILRSLFAIFDMLVTIVSDNGSQFTSAKFDFCISNGIDHITIAPYHPQSNGQTEQFVDTSKRVVKKIREERGSIQHALDIFLLPYRSTPNRALPGNILPSECQHLKILDNLDVSIVTTQFMPRYTVVTDGSVAYRENLAPGAK